jgi:hypothetical protein
VEGVLSVQRRTREAHNSNSPPRLRPIDGDSPSRILPEAAGTEAPLIPLLMLRCVLPGACSRCADLRAEACIIEPFSSCCREQDEFANEWSVLSVDGRGARERVTHLESFYRSRLFSLIVEFLFFRLQGGGELLSFSLFLLDSIRMSYFCLCSTERVNCQRLDRRQNEGGQEESVPCSSDSERLRTLQPC